MSIGAAMKNQNRESRNCCDFDRHGQKGHLGVEMPGSRAGRHCPVFVDGIGSARYQASKDESGTLQRRKRRKNARTRQRRPGNGLPKLLTVAMICMLAAISGYIGVYKGDAPDAGLAYKAQAAEETVYEYVTVHKGDTVWGIASSYAEPSRDIRKYVREICDLNGVKPGSIYPGQVLIVPIPAHLA